MGFGWSVGLGVWVVALDFVVLGFCGFCVVWLGDVFGVWLVGGLGGRCVVGCLVGLVICVLGLWGGFGGYLGFSALGGVGIIWFMGV